MLKQDEIDEVVNHCLFLSEHLLIGTLDFSLAAMLIDTLSRSLLA